jgi:hypothetical protein
MNGGTISGNGSNPLNSGGGVAITSVSSGDVSDVSVFTMNNGTITNNVASKGGGGVAMGSDIKFNKIGGTITGYDSDPINGNVAGEGGHAVYASCSGVEKRKETTAEPAVNLSWTVVGGTPPTWSGDMLSGNMKVPKIDARNL